MSEHHNILGVPAGASKRDIERAYRRLARQHHPDRCPGDEGASDRFRLVHAAYFALTGKEERADEKERAEALILLSNCLREAILHSLQHGVTPDRRDMVALMRQGLGANREEHRKVLRTLAKARSGLLAMQGRFSGGEGSPDLEGMVAQHLHQVEGEQETINAHLKKVALALEMLKSCSFRFEQAVRAYTMGSLTASTSTSGMIFGTGF
jgi:hypothetical protein